jgi:hypothetical protein
MKSEKSVLRLAASAPADWTSGLDDNSRFANVVMPHIDDAYRLARWLTANIGSWVEDRSGRVVARFGPIARAFTCSLIWR